MIMVNLIIKEVNKKRRRIWVIGDRENSEWSLWLKAAVETKIAFLVHISARVNVPTNLNIPKSCVPLKWSISVSDVTHIASSIDRKIYFFSRAAINLVSLSSRPFDIHPDLRTSCIRTFASSRHHGELNELRSLVFESSNVKSIISMSLGGNRLRWKYLGISWTWIPPDLLGCCPRNDTAAVALGWHAPRARPWTSNQCRG